MFFSPDLLTSQGVGLRLPWLMGTLSSAAAAAIGTRGGSGEGSTASASLRRFSRREVASYDLSKACDVIQHPPYPLALRLSGHLMHGTARIYVRKAGYWMADVSTAFTDVRRALLQKQTSSTTPAGIIIVGRDTSTIDLPARRRSDRNPQAANAAVTLPLPCAGVRALELRDQIDRNEWWNDEHLPGVNGHGRNGLPGLGSQDSPFDSLSMFGSSIWSAEEARRAGSVDLGLGVLTHPEDKPYTVNPEAIRRPSSVLRQSPLPGQSAFGLDDYGFDFFDIDQPPPLGDDTTGGLRLDLDGPVDDTLGDEQLGNGGMLLQDDDVQGFALEQPGAEAAANEDDRPSKRRRLAPKYDRETVLGDEAVRFHRANYTQLMQGMRTKQAVQAAIKTCEGHTRMLLLGIDDEALHVVVDLWNASVMARVDSARQLTRPAKRVADNTDARVATEAAVSVQAEDHAFDMLDDWQPDNDAVEGHIGALAPGDDTALFDESAEIGRGAAFPSEHLDLPWARTALAPLDSTINAPLDDTVQSVALRSMSIETPTGLKRVQRGSSVSGASGGESEQPRAASAGRRGAGATSRLTTPLRGEAQTASQLLAQQDVADFFGYVQCVRETLTADDDATGAPTLAGTPKGATRSQPLFFSDLAPVADTAPPVAARAFYNVLALTTMRHMRVEQREPYGEIQIEVLA